ncbi:MAG TPA: hypothetical protein VMK12_09735 [Anaeromyxobacteraceae bacterium]|nr:hypothetical protein [Anaeromyxobacteraceae bacterium]
MSERAIPALVFPLTVCMLAACQGYNFSPVARCIAQPGSTQVTLEDITTADIVFVVDDSASMTSKQAALAANFNQFINALNQFNIQRVNQGVAPFDFHIAVTTSSIYWAQPDPAGTICLLDGGQTQCCAISPTSCAPAPSPCTPGSDCASGGKCAISRSSIGGAGAYPPVSFSYQCCTGAPANCQPQSCFPGDACPRFTTTYSTSGCSTGLFANGAPYSAGSFVAAPGNPSVLHFTKDLYEPVPNEAALAALSQQFGQNIQVGNCGSPQEQHLEAARLAVQKAISGQYGSDFPHLGAKLIVVWVGDEDDCSSPGPGASSTDASKSIILAHSADTGADECVADKNVSTQNPNVPPRAFPVADYDSYFASLVAPAGHKTTASQPYREFSAAFIAGTVPCVDSNSEVIDYAPADQYLLPVCSAATTPLYSVPSRSCPFQDTGIWAEGVRFSQLASAIRGRGYSVVQDTVCDSIPPASFGNVLSRIADLVTAPSALVLPTQPGSGEVAFVEVDDANGNRVKACQQALTQADTATAGWWFMRCGTPTNPPPPVATDSAGNAVGTSCIFINHAAGSCEANPGQTYVARYLGMVPPNGCAGPSLDVPTSSGQASCANALGGNPQSWWCYGQPTASRGTCTCVGQ